MTSIILCCFGLLWLCAMIGLVVEVAFNRMWDGEDEVDACH